MKRERPVVTIENIKRAHAERREEICARLDEFAAIHRSGDDRKLWEEMVFCFFTGGCSARMGINALDAVRDRLMHADQPELAAKLRGVHRYPNARSRYIVASRTFLNERLSMRLRDKLESFDCHHERRDWLVKEKGIKGLGYKEASHYLRNVGYRGYAILDKHVLNCLVELKIIDEAKPPNTRSKYLSTEYKLRQLTDATGIDFDELDLVLWSMKTGVVLK